ncbi:MAG: hypothetical protein IT426_11055 [Pirellulales bacterium]|nr:hypothetical protein [Pirellulales bacterium]
MSVHPNRRRFFFSLFLVLIPFAGVAFSRAADKPSGSPATAAEAAKVIDLSTLPLAAGAEKPPIRRIAGLTYQAPGTVKKAYEFHRKQLLERKWKELPGGYASDQSSNGAFARDGFTLSLMVFLSGKADEAYVTIMNHGNVKLDKLPLPAGAKPLYAGPASAMFVAETPVKETAEACKKLLLAEGWQPYGAAGDTHFFKKNAVALSAFITTAPAQGGKTSIQYGTSLMSVDLPAPAETLQLKYSDAPTQLSFDSAATQQEIVDFYRKTLGRSGWKATADAPIKIDFRHELIFRNPGKDLLTLEMSEVEGKSRVLLKYQTAAEVAEIGRLAKAELARRNAEADKPLPKLTVAIPSEATEIERSKNRLEFKLPAGKAKAVVESWRKQFGKDGWKETVAAMEDVAGSISFDKGDRHLALIYSDTGFLPAEITLQATGVEFERAAEKQ